MALEDFIARTETVEHNGKSLRVRGLGLEDLAIMFMSQSEEMEQAVEIIRGAVKDRAKVDDQQIVLIFQQLLRMVPTVVYQAIACACDEPGNLSAVSKWSLPLQTKAAMAVARATFEDVGGFEDFMGNVKAALTAAMQHREAVKGGLTKLRATG